MLRSPDSISKEDIIIEDPNLEPFFIVKSKSGGYVTYKRVKRGLKNKAYIQTINYPSNFNSALQTLAKEKVGINNKKKYDSIGEYIEMYENIVKEMRNVVNPDL